MKTLVTIRYFEMNDPDRFRPVPGPRPAGYGLHRVPEPFPPLNRFFYTAIGGDWHWTDRLPWTLADWMAFLGRPGVETWVGTWEGIPCGYFELDQSDESGVELAYFGLLAAARGKGLGKALLSDAIARAWEKKPSRVWVHTCSLDHPHAAANYAARGFREFKVTASEKDVPEKTPGPWPGSR